MTDQTTWISEVPSNRRRSSYKVIVTKLKVDNSGDVNIDECGGGDPEPADQMMQMQVEQPPNLTPSSDDVKPELFTCGFCDAAFVTHLSLRRHMVVYHENEPTFTCSICQNEFCKEDQLSKHFNEEHGHNSSTVVKLETEYSEEGDDEHHFQDNVDSDGENREHEHDEHFMSEDELDGENEEVHIKTEREEGEIEEDDPENMELDETPEYDDLFAQYADEDEDDEGMQMAEDPLAEEGSSNDYVQNGIEMNKSPSTLLQSRLLQQSNGKPQVKIQIPLLGLIPAKSTEDAESLNKIGDSLNGVQVEKYHICQECGTTFASKVNLQRHLQTHSQDRPHACHLCAKAFLRKEHLLKHLSSVHSGLKFRCEFCKKEISRKDHLIRHIRNVHPTEYIGLPPEIQSPMIDNQNLESLSLTSLQAAGFVLSEKALESMTPKPKRPYLSCDMCDETFILLDDLHAHQSDIHRDVRKYKCPDPDCPKAFKRKEHLTKHSVLHTGERNFNCNICGKTFPRKDALRDHIRRVHGTGQVTCTEYPCHLCDKAFLQRPNLIRHFKNVHGLVVNVSQNGAPQQLVVKALNPTMPLVRPPQIPILGQGQQLQLQPHVSRPRQQQQPRLPPPQKLLNSTTKLIQQTQQHLDKISHGKSSITISAVPSSSVQAVPLDTKMTPPSPMAACITVTPQVTALVNKGPRKVSPSFAIRSEQFRPRAQAPALQVNHQQQQQPIRANFPAPSSRVISFP